MNHQRWRNKTQGGSGTRAHSLILVHGTQSSSGTSPAPLIWPERNWKHKLFGADIMLAFVF